MSFYLVAGQSPATGKRVNSRKRHIVVDTCGLLLVVLVTGAGVQDRDAARLLLWALRTCFPGIAKVRCDGGYAGQHSRPPTTACSMTRL